MNFRTQKGIQRIIDTEVILIIIGLGIDIFIGTLLAHDYLAGAIIVVGLTLMGAVYWHTLHIDRLAQDVRDITNDFFHTHTTSEHATTITPPVIPLPAATVATPNVPQNVPLSAVSDRPVLHVSNFLLSKNFYEQVLGVLGYSLILNFPALGMASLGTSTDSDLWIKTDGAKAKIRASFRADSAELVDSFYYTALDMGGIEAESPALRPSKGDGYYSAAVYDPDGSTVEAFFLQ